MKTLYRIWHGTSGLLQRLIGRLERAHLVFVGYTGRLEPLLSLSAIGMALFWVLGTWNIDPNPDAYYHLGVAASYMAAFSDGRWFSELPVLPFTILADSPFPNLYLLQHLMLAPLTRVMSGPEALYIAMGLTGFALLASIYFVLRDWGVRGAIWWTQLVWLISPSLFAYVVLLKGAAFFMIWMVWTIHALVAGKYRAVFVFSLLAGYSYVAAYLLILMAGCFALAALFYRRKFEWQGVVATSSGWVLSSLINPGFPNNLELMWVEFGNALTFPGAWEAGIWIGAEWSGISLHSLAISLGFALIPWLFLLPVLPKLSGFGRTLGGCLLLSILALVLAFYSGSKGVAVAAVLYCLLLPLALHRLSDRPAMSWAALVWLSGLLGYSLWQGYGGYSERNTPSFVYEARAVAIAANREAGNYSVITAPWSDFPWLFYFNPRNYYVAGMNLLFLNETPEQLQAYHALYDGRIQNPEIVLQRCFLSNLLVVFKYPGSPGEQRLLQTLRNKKQYFREIDVPLPHIYEDESSRVLFRLDAKSVAERLEALKALDGTDEEVPLCEDPPEEESSDADAPEESPLDQTEDASIRDESPQQPESASGP